MHDVCPWSILYLQKGSLSPHKRVGVVFFPKYQRFIEDRRLLENMGLVEKSSVTAYLEEYYEKHPLDNSYEGVLARRSGLTKDQVIAYLEKLEYLAKIAEYDPTGKAPILKGDAREDHQFRIKSKNNEEYLLGVNIFYIEERRIINFAS